MLAKIFKLVLLATLLAALISPPAMAQGPVPGNLQPRDMSGITVEQVPSVDLTDAIRTADGKVGVIVMLKDAPLATYQGGVPGLSATSPQITGAVKLDVTSPASVAYLAYLEQAQSKFTAELAQAVPSAAVEQSYRVALNGFSMKIDEKELTALLKLDSVAQVFPDQIRQAEMDAGLDLINAPELWATLGGQNMAGQGVKVAVIDSGLRFANPMFGNPRADGLPGLQVVVAMGAMTPNNGTEARARVMHASPDAPAVDVYVNGTKAIDDLTFGEVTDYISLLPAVPYTVEVKVHGTAVVVLTQVVAGLPGTDYTLAAANVASALEVVPVVDDNSAPLAGQARVRFVHLSPNAPAVDIDAAPADGAGLIFTDIEFKEASAAMVVPPGLYDLQAVLTGTTDLALNVPNLNVMADMNYTAFAVGLAGGEAFELPFGYPRGYCLANPLDPEVQCNGKVIAADYFFDPALASTTNLLEVMTPEDIDGHGSHTAGTSAGNPVVVPAGIVSEETTDISGVAPGAYLMVYKALFTNLDASSASGTDAMLTAALDAALMDGADVINNSWGGNAGGNPNGSVYQSLIGNIVEAGTVVVFSAGNSGPGSTTIGCPGCVESALTVAASTTDRIFANTVSVTGPGTVPANLASIPGMQGTGPELTADLLDEPLKFVASNANGCAAFTAGAFTDSVALIQRGTCNFSVKVNNAAAAGAIAVIVFNNTGGPPSSMGSLELTTIPSLMVDKTLGEALRDFVIANPTATISIDSTITRLINPAWTDILAGFSSVGPNGDPDVLKPDITAPGVNTLSAFSGILGGDPDPHYALLQGTSMAAPHVTGAAALVRDLYPDLTAPEIKTLLTSTANMNLKKPDGVTAADAFNMGGGRLDLDMAQQAGLVFDKPSFASGGCVLNCAWDNTLKNIGGAAATWTAAVTSDFGLNVTVSPDTFTLDPGLAGSFMVDADVTALAPGAWKFATVTWTDGSGTYPAQHLQMAVRAATSTDSLTVTKSVDKPEAADGETLSYTIDVGNFSAVERTFFVNDPIPANTVYVDASVSPNAAYNAVDDAVEATFTLDPLSATLTPSDYIGGFFDLTAYKVPFGALDLDALCTACDDTAFNISGVSFSIFGLDYTSVGVSSNGFFQPGGATSATANVQPLPDVAAPNGVIAPLWTDLNLDVAGDWFVIGVNLGGDDYTVFQWTSVPQYGAPAVLYSFQLWIQDGTSNMWFTYATLPAAFATYDTSIGVEDPSGSTGYSYYYKEGAVTTGTPPNPASLTPDLAVATVADSETITFDVTVELTDLSATEITNIVQVANNLNQVIDLAIADTVILYNKIYMPLIFH